MPTVKKAHICSGCLNSFDSKSINIATKPGASYTTYYCKECIESYKIEDFKPYLKPRAKKAK